MRNNTRTFVLLVVLAAMVLSTVLSGCGAINAARQVADVAKELATSVPQQIATKAAEETPEPEPEATKAPQTEATPAEESTKLEGAFNKFVKLAPVHMSSSWVSKKGDEVRASMSLEADIDAAGNQHIIIVTDSGEEIEVYVVDKKMYIKAEGDQYVNMGAGDSDDFSFLLTFGGAYLLSFNDLKDAKLVGTEAVGPWQAQKYEIKMDLSSLGISGLAAGVQGAQWDYQGFAWIEPSKGALVKSLVDWSSKSSGSAQLESYHAEFLASPGTVTEIEAPENVITMG